MPLLSLAIFLPLAGALLIGLLGALSQLPPLSRWRADPLAEGPLAPLSRWIAIATSTASLLAIAWIWFRFDSAAVGPQAVTQLVWIRRFGIEYFVGVDGLSVSLLLLSGIIALVATLASRRYPPAYQALLLLLQTGMHGTFAALDMVLFYVFFEMVLLPMYFLIGIWGGPRREAAALKFFLYTLAGSVLILLGIIGLYWHSYSGFLGDGTFVEHTFDLTLLAKQGHEGIFTTVAPLFGCRVDRLIFVALAIGFAIKVPIVPLHTWLPDAHVEAPTPISVILAGVLLKMGIYGLLRFNALILPEATGWASTVFAGLGIGSILYAAFVALAQRDLKRLVAYSSVSHMGYSLLGIAAMTPLSITGSVANLFTHGLVSAMLFLLVGVIYDRAHHRDIDRLGGLALQMPEYAGLAGLAFFASLGLPGLCSFVSEFLILSGSIARFTLQTAFAAAALVITAGYLLWALQRVFLGKANGSPFTDLTWRERLTLYPLAMLILLLGIFPGLLLNPIRPSLFLLSEWVRGSWH